ncbi:hypothetical protein SASPL_126198 [Salvia splendens]|uniref:Uncharacterized protein n=1 Tax=Salvia splendens TaxID=180675 RepID=A0A8X8XGS5_SALSN|nr:hypothetical protein SASPL_126198 [Salvia splendens]
MFTTFLNRNKNQMANPKVFFDMTIGSAPADRIVIKLQKFNHKISYKCAATYYPLVITASSNMFTTFLNRNQNQMANPKVFFDMTIGSATAGQIVIKLQKFNHKISYKCAATYYPIVNTTSSNMFTTFLNRNQNLMANPKVFLDMTIGSAPADRIVIKLQKFNHKISYKCAATYYPIVNTASSNMFTTFLNRNQNQMANPKVFFDMTIGSAPAGPIVIKLQKFNHKISYKCAATYYPIVNTASSNMFTTFLNRNQNQMANPKVFFAMTIGSALADRIVIKLQKFNHKISYKYAQPITQ